VVTPTLDGEGEDRSADEELTFPENGEELCLYKGEKSITERGRTSHAIINKTLVIERNTTSRNEKKKRVKGGAGKE